ncbi:MAG: CHAT domain-containing protein [Microscillaceae bacterium]|nr:CHAT domain-containing protein [Microscillaceae bacterium]
MSLYLKTITAAIIMTLAMVCPAIGQENNPAIDSLIQKGDDLLKNRQFSLAKDLFQKAGDISYTRQQWNLYCQCQRKTALSMAYLGQSALAIQYLQNYWDFCLAKLSMPNEESAKYYGNMAYFRMLNKDADSITLPLYQKALDIALQMPKAYPLQAATYLSVGYFHYARGLYRDALDSYHQHQQIMEKHLDIYDESNTSSYNYLGSAYMQMGMNELALEYFRQELKVRSKKFKNQPKAIADIHLNIGLIYAKWQIPDSAYYHLSTAKKNYGLGQDFSKTVLAQAHLLGVYQQRKQYDSLDFYFQKALKYYQTKNIQDVITLAKVYEHKGTAFFEREVWDSAYFYYQKVLNLKKPKYNSKNPITGEEYRVLGLIHSQQNHLDSALYYAQKSLITHSFSFNEWNFAQNPVIENNDFSPIDLLKVLNFKTKVLLLKFKQNNQLPDLNIARQTLELADRLINQIRDVFQNRNDKIELAKITRLMYELGLEISLMQTEPENFFYFAEKTRANLLQDRLLENRLKIDKSVSPDSIALLRRLEDEVAFLYKTIAEQPTQAEKYRTLLFEKKREKQKLEATLQAKIGKNSYCTRIVKISEVQKKLENKDLIISYICSENELYINVIGQNEWQIKTINISYQALKTKVTNYYKHLLAYNPEKLVKSSQDLYEVLLLPIAEYLSGKTVLRIIPDQILHSLPFEALIENIPSNMLANRKYEFDKLPYLLHRFEFVYFSSVSLWYNEDLFAQPNSFAYEFAGFAPFSTEDANLIASFAKSGFRQDLGILKHSYRELKTIAEMFMPQSSLVYFQQNAQEQTLKKIRQVRYLHLATHSLADLINPTLSRVAFYPSSTQSENLDSLSVYSRVDGALYFEEISNLDLRAEMIVLSSCESGVGKYAEGEGLLSIVKAFMSLGVPNLVYSLWTVEDEYTADLMIEYYRNLSQTKPNQYRQALTAAKRKFARNPKTAYPRWWAGFLLISK